MNAPGLSVGEKDQLERFLTGFDSERRPLAESLFKGLNREQAVSLCHPPDAGTPLLILAGAGSGKTTVLTRRVAALLLRGIAADELFVSTFTVKAAGEMKSRIGRLLGDLAKDAGPAVREFLIGQERTLQDAWIGTFHSLCLRILRTPADGGTNLFQTFGLPPRPRLLSDREAGELLRRAAGEIASATQLRDLPAALDLAANDLLTPDALAGMERCGGLPGDIVGRAFAAYNAAKREAGVVDFTDLLYLSAESFADNRPGADAWRKKFTQILIDEYQDTNLVQYVISRELAASRRNLFVVGDDDQSIYAFRGADIRNIRMFKEDYPDAAIVKLIRNYRSTPVILGAANALLMDKAADSGTGEMEKTLLAGRTLEKMEKITVFEAADESDELEYVAFEIGELQKEGYHYRDIVVFYRVHALSTVVGQAFSKNSIPFTAVGNLQVADSPYFITIRALIEIAAALNRLARESSDRVVESLTIREALAALMQAGLLVPADERDRHRLSMLPAPERLLLDESAYVEAVQACVSGGTQAWLETLWRVAYDAAYRLESLAPPQLHRAIVDGFSFARRAETDKEIAEGMKLMGRFLDVRLPYAPAGLDGVDALLTALSKSAQGEATADLIEADQVRLMTIHAAKGLEFPVVFVVAVEEDVLPYVNPAQIGKTTTEQAVAQEEEELRLFYVAITRAKDRLYLTSAARRFWYGRPAVHAPSRFLNMLPASLVHAGSSLNAMDKLANRTTQFFKDLFSS